MLYFAKLSSLPLMHRVLCLVLVGLLAAGLLGQAGFLPLLHAASNPIILENQLPGTDEWQIPNSSGTKIANDTTKQIKGYASAPSVNLGSSLTFYVTVNTAQTFTIDFYRMGWYAGLGGRFIQHVGPINGVTQPACPIIDNNTKLRACSWAASYTLAVPTTWTDGVYLAVLTNAQKFQNYVPFVVRNDTRVAALLYQQPVNTYEAYNSWGGKSLYTYNSSNSIRAYKVSFDRPYEGDGSADYFGWEVYFVQWLEQQGYDVTYSTDVDTHENGGRLLNFKGFLSAGHNEYWSKAMFDAAQNARDAGVSLGFFGADPIQWQVRYEPSASGAPDRVIVCYKTSEAPNPTDPITATNPALTTDQWRFAPINRPEQTLVGVQFTSQTGNDWDTTAPFVVANSANWVYAGTGFTDGTVIPGLTGYEADRSWMTYPLPSNQSYTLLASSPYTSVDGVSDTQNTAVYQALSGAWVFGAGTMSWSWALARPSHTNAGIQKATANILNRFITNVPVNVTPTPTATQPPTPTPAPSTYRPAVLANNPLAYWRLNEPPGAITAGDQKLTYNGSYNGSPTMGQPGALTGDTDPSVAFNSSGTGEYVSVPYTAALNPPTFSVEVWAKPTGGAGAYRGVMASRWYPTGWVIYASGGNSWQFWINSGAGMAVVDGGPVVLNSWTHLVATFDGTTARFYVNGVLVGSGAATYSPQATTALTIGQGEPANNFWFPGQLDEPAVYNTALSAAQVQNHYQIGTTGHP